MDSKYNITEILRNIETINDIKILHANEAGSRAWGFPSPDSDYDIRFIYVHPLDQYLRLDKRNDTMQWFAEEREQDFSGWDIKKTLCLFASCNPVLNEYLNSPVLYTYDEYFLTTLRQLIPKYFQPVKTVWHYFSLARNIRKSHRAGEPFGVKKFFYVLRPLLACEWVREYVTMPPTDFHPLLDLPVVTKDFKDAVLDLIEVKKTMNEKNPILILPFIEEETDRFYQRVATHAEIAASYYPPSPQKDWQPLNTLFFRIIFNM